MTDKVYTQQELKEMADQLLAADDKKKAGKAAAQKAEEAKPAADKALEEKLAKCPAARCFWLNPWEGGCRKSSPS